MKTDSKINTALETQFHPCTFAFVVSSDFPGRSQPANVAQYMSTGRARRVTGVVLIISAACDQAQSGCAWLMHLRAHVQSMMSWRLLSPAEYCIPAIGI